MASGLLPLLDDIATMLDDVSVMAKKAATKAAGAAADDLLVNAEQITSMRTQSEMKIVMRIALGSMVNKIILVPTLLLIAMYVPWVMTALLIAGGLYLCYEGAEKVLHHNDKRAQTKEALNPEQIQSRTRGAIRTDFVLSAEILVIAMSQMTEASLGQYALALALMAVMMTLLVYGAVAVIVKIDDLGLWLSQRRNALASAIGMGLLRSAPIYMRCLSIAGTIAMLLVGGAILAQNIPPVKDFIEYWVEHTSHLGRESQSALVHGAFGFCTGAITMMAISLTRRLRPLAQPHP